MSGVKTAEGFISGVEAKEELRKLLRASVGPRKGMAPDLVFALKVIEQTIPRGVLQGEKLERFEKAMKLLWKLRDNLCQVEAMIDLYWQPDENEENEDA